MFVDGRVEVRGIARHAKDSQRLYNYFVSNDAETTALQPKQPYLMPDVCLGPFQKTWDDSVDQNFPYLPYHVDEDHPQLKPYREQPAMPSGGNAVQLQRADQDMRDTVGIQKAALGMQSNEKSGIAIRERKIETDTGQYAFLDNLSVGVLTTGKIILSMIPEVYDAPRMLRILGPDYKEKIIAINQQGGIDITSGLFDIDIDVGPSQSTQREEFVEKIAAILPNMPPEQVAMITDILFEMMDFSRADDIAQRLKKMLPPGILETTEQQPGAPGAVVPNETQGAVGPAPPGGPQPPSAGGPTAPPIDPRIPIEVEILQVKLQQEQAKLAGLQIENENKQLAGKERLREIIEQIMNEGPASPEGGTENAA